MNAALSLARHHIAIAAKAVVESGITDRNTMIALEALETASMRLTVVLFGGKGATAIHGVKF